jgi:hypothetical protein
MLALFLQAPANIFTEDELKHIFLYVHPTTWVDRFENAGMMAASEQMGEIKHYMEHQATKEALAAPRQKKNYGNNNNNGNGNNGNSSHCNCSRGTDTFYSGQELEPEMYEPFVKIQQLASVSPFEIKIPAVNPTTKLDLVPHILATGLRIGNLHNKYVFNLTQAEPIP